MAGSVQEVQNPKCETSHPSRQQSSAALADQKPASALERISAVAEELSGMGRRAIRSMKDAILEELGVDPPPQEVGLPPPGMSIVSHTGISACGGALPGVCETLDISGLPAARESSAKRVLPSDPFAEVISPSNAERLSRDERLVRAEVGERVSIGKEGDIRIGENSPFVSRQHLTVEPLPDGRWRVFDGVPPSKEGTFRVTKTGVEVVEGAVPIKPGDTIEIGTHRFAVPALEGSPGPEWAAVVAKLTSGEQVIIGRSRMCDIRFEDSSVSRQHAILERRPDGKLYLVDGRPSVNGAQVFEGGKWRPLSCVEDLPAGTVIRVGHYEIRLPERNARPFHGRGRQFDWQSPGTPEQMIDQIRYHDPEPSPVKAGAGQIVKVYGASAEQLFCIENALRNIKDKLGFDAIYVGKELGEKLFPGREELIDAFPVNGRRQLLVSAHLLGDPKRAARVLPHLSKMAEMADEYREVHMDYTKRYVDDLQRAGRHQHGEDAPYGRYGGRHIIGKDAPINGGVHLRGNIAMVIDDIKYPELNEVYRKFYFSQFSEGPRDLDGVKILRRVYDYVCGDMRYDKRADEIVLDVVGIQSAANFASPVKLDFYAYINSKVGVCDHQAIYCAYLVERLKREGILDDAFRISYERNRTPLGNHAWARATMPNGTVYILDPARNYFGPLNGPHSWLYARPAEVREEMQEPV